MHSESAKFSQENAKYGSFCKDLAENFGDSPSSQLLKIKVEATHIGDMLAPLQGETVLRP